jgi:hypothetical protein
MPQRPCPAYFPKVIIMLGGRALSFPETLKRWHSRWAAIHKVRSLDKHQQGELARDLALPEGNVVRLIARGHRARDEADCLMSVLGLNMQTVQSNNPGLARDISVVCSDCVATKRCRRELDAGSSRTSYHAYCPNAQTFDELRQEAWRNLKRNHRIMADRVVHRE